MADKTLYTLKLGGNDVTLVFRVGSVRLIKSLSGKDPLELLSGADTIGNIDFAELIVRAGMLAADKKADVSQVTDWVDNMELSQIGQILKAFTTAILPDVTTEGDADTQQGQAADTTGAV